MSIVTVRSTVTRAGTRIAISTPRRASAIVMQRIGAVTPTRKRGGSTVNSGIISIGGSSATNLSINNRNSQTLDIASDTGTAATIPAASSTLSGLLTVDGFIKLSEAATQNALDDEVLARQQADVFEAEARALADDAEEVARIDGDEQRYTKAESDARYAPIGSGLAPYYIPDNETIYIPANKQMLFAINCVVDGFIICDGFICETN